MDAPSVKAIEKDSGTEQDGGTDGITVINPKQWYINPGNEDRSLQMITVTANEHVEYEMQRKNMNYIYNNARDRWVGHNRNDSKYYKELVDNCPLWKNSPGARKRLTGLFKRFPQGSLVEAPELTENLTFFLTEKEKLNNKLRDEYLEMRIKKLDPRDKNNLELAHRECSNDKDKFMQVTITGTHSTFMLEGFYQKRKANSELFPTAGGNNSLTQTIFLKQLNPTKFSIARPLEMKHNPKHEKEEQESRESFKPTGALFLPTETRKPLAQKHISIDTAKMVGRNSENKDIMVASPTEWSYSSHKTDSPSLIMITLTSNEYYRYDKERRRDEQIKDNCKQWVAKEKEKKDGEYKTLFKNYQGTGATKLRQYDLGFIKAKNEIDKNLKRVYVDKLFNEIDPRDWRSLELAYQDCLEDENTFMTTTITSNLSTYALRAWFEKRKANGGPFSILETKKTSVGEHSNAKNELCGFYQRQGAFGPIPPASGQSSKTSEVMNPASLRRLDEVNKKPFDDKEILAKKPKIEPINAKTITENIQCELHSTTSTDRSRFPHIPAIPENGTKKLKRPLRMDIANNTVKDYAPQFKRSKTETESQNLAPLEALHVKSFHHPYSVERKNESADRDYRPLENRNQTNRFAHTQQNQNNGHQICKHNQHLQSRFHEVKVDRVEDESMEQRKPNSKQDHGSQSLRQSTPMEIVTRFVGGTYYPEIIRIEQEPV